MGVRSLFSFVLLAIPIGVTLAVLISLDAHRIATGQAPLFQDNSINHDTYCQKSYGISPQAKGQTYTLNPNQWGWTTGDPGQLCMNVTTFNNNTYATNTTAPQFSVTWQYPQGPASQPVHAFPNIQLDANPSGAVSNRFPTQIQSISQMSINVVWSYTLGNVSSNATTIDVNALAADNVNTNVAIDMFIDSDSTKAQSSTQAKYEVMVWLAMIGSSTQPIGYAAGAVTSQVINGTTFNMFAGQNGLGQWVLTWLATEAMPVFVGDIAPLLTSIPSLNNANYPATADYLGYMGLGSETLWTPQFVTFDVSHLSMDVRSL